VAGRGCGLDPVLDQGLSYLVERGEGFLDRLAVAETGVPPEFRVAGVEAAALGVRDGSDLDEVAAPDGHRDWSHRLAWTWIVRWPTTIPWSNTGSARKQAS